RAPVHLFARALMTRIIAGYHQSGLGDAPELPFHQLRPAQGQAQILLRSFALETKPPILQRKFLESPERQQEAGVVDGDERVAVVLRARLQRCAASWPRSTGAWSATGRRPPPQTRRARRYRSAAPPPRRGREDPQFAALS